MFKYIPGNRNFIISLNGEIRTSQGKLPELERNGNLVNIDLYGKRETLDVMWLALIANFEIDLPHNFKKITFREANPNTFSTNSGFIPKAPPIVIDGKYRVILSHPHYAVSEDGVVIAIKTRSVIQITEGADKYPVVLIHDPDQNRFRRILVHRLVALAWCPNNDFIAHPIVNHKDGNKKNFHRKNLEWCSYSENTKHAFATGLMGKTETDKYKVKDLQTGVIQTYSSVRELMREIGMSDRDRWKIRSYKTQPTILLDRYEVKSVDDDSQWHDAGVVPKKNKHTVKVTFPNGDVETFGDNLSLMRRFKIWNISYNVKEIVGVLKRKHPDFVIEVIENFSSKPIQALNVVTKEVIETNTIRRMALLTDTAFSVIQNAVNKNDLYVHNHFIFRFKTDEAWPSNFRRNPNAPKPIRATNVETGEEVIFPDLGKALQTLGVSRYVLYSKIQSREVIDGWVISEVI